MSFFGRIRESLTRTKQQIVQQFDDIVRGADAPENRSRSLDVDTLDALEEVLISADLGMAASSAVISAVKAQPRDGTSLRDLVKREIRRIFSVVDVPVAATQHPKIVLVVGVNGTGKTTTVGKLANLLKSQGRQPLICAADTFRAAAREVPGAPHEVLLVLDATVGQNGVAQAREFMNVAGVNGIVLTKLDGTAKGGVAVAIANDLKLPIRYVGVGEKIDDLVPFSADEYVNGLFEEKW